MRTVLRIFMRDLRRVLRNPVALVVTVGVALIPALYAWLNILANWDPYANTGDLPVAVANLDEGATVPGVGALNAGDEVTRALKDNDRLDWQFVGRDEAVQGVESGAYYAAIVIPQDFSADLASVTAGHLERPKLLYYVNEKLNPVAPKVTDSGADTVEQAVDEEFVRVATQVVAERLSGSADAAAEDTRQAGEDAASQLRQARQGLQGLADQVDAASATCDASRQALAPASDLAQGLGTSAQTADATLADVLGRLGTARSSAREQSRALGSAWDAAGASLSGLGAQASQGVGGLAADLGTAQGAAEAARARLQAVHKELARAKASVDTALAALPEGAAKDRLTAVSQALQEQLDAQQALLDQLGQTADAAGDALASAQTRANQAAEAVGTGAGALSAAGATVRTEALPQLDGALDDASDAAWALRSSLATAAPAAQQAQAAIASADAALQEASATLASTAQTLRQGAQELQNAEDTLGLLRTSAAQQALEGAEGTDPDELASFMAAPVSLQTKAVFPVANYGSGVAPFYTNLALFVGGFVLVSVFKLEVDQEGLGPVRPWQGYLGRWLLLNLVGTLQALVTCLGDLALGIQCQVPAAFVLAGLVQSFVYVGIVYALAVAFKHVGKALAVLLVIVQIPGSSGLYPIQMQPAFFQGIGPWLPFTYGVNAMREAVAGFYGTAYWHDLALLLLYVAPSLLVGLGMRRWLLNVNGLFDRELRATRLMACERDPVPAGRPGLAMLVRAALGAPAYRAQVRQRAERFQRLYPRLVRAGFVGLAASLAVLLVPLAAPGLKLAMLSLWVWLVVGLVAFLLVTEYLHDRLDRRSGLVGLPHARLLRLLDERAAAATGAGAGTRVTVREADAGAEARATDSDADGDTATAAATGADDAPGSPEAGDKGEER